MSVTDAATLTANRKQFVAPAPDRVSLCSVATNAAETTSRKAPAWSRRISVILEPTEIFQGKERSALAGVPTT
jgi:hypothetical protein